MAADLAGYPAAAKPRIRRSTRSPRGSGRAGAPPPPVRRGRPPPSPSPALFHRELPVPAAEPALALRPRPAPATRLLLRPRFRRGRAYRAGASATAPCSPAGDEAGAGWGPSSRVSPMDTIGNTLL